MIVMLINFQSKVGKKMIEEVLFLHESEKRGIDAKKRIVLCPL